MILHIISQMVQWLATIFRASGMLAKDANKVKYLVSLGNLCFAIGGVLDQNAPLVASNAICLAIMVVDIIKERRKK
mgnify:CR=1 FL=1